MLQRQWDGLVQAPDGSIKNRFYRWPVFSDLAGRCQEGHELTACIDVQCRMAMAVLAREDVTESFLKTIPTDVAQLQLIAPVRTVSASLCAPCCVSLPAKLYEPMQADLPVSVASTERYVRRRMRLMLRQQERLHQCRMVRVRCHVMVLAWSFTYTDVQNLRVGELAGRNCALCAAGIPAHTKHPNVLRRFVPA